MATLSIDAGTTVIKAVVFSDDGAELAVSAHPTTVSQTHPGWSEQDMDEVWHSVVSACTDVFSAVHATDIDTVAVTAQGDGAWLIDEDGNPLRPAILWNDARAADLIAHWDVDGTTDKIFSINGSLPSLGLPNAIMMWLQREEPQILAQTKGVLTCGSWIFYKLTGVIGQHISEASAPWLDIKAGVISDVLIDEYGLKDHRDRIPPVLSNSQTVAEIRDELSHDWGLQRGVPCVIAPYDIVATATGSGATRPGDAFAILGTTICPGTISPTVQLDGAVTGLNLRGVGDGHFLRAFPTITGANTLGWLAKVLSVENLDELNRQAAATPPGSQGVMWLPYLSPAGERAPFFDPHAQGLLFGLRETHGPGEIARALFESLGYLIKESLDASGTSPTSLVLSGGGAQSDLWCQIIADTVGVPTRRTMDSQVGAKGAQIYAQVAQEKYSSVSEAADALVRVADVFEPDTGDKELHHSRYRRFLALRQAIQPFWHEQ